MSRPAKSLTLSEEARQRLAWIDDRGSDWRERRRARTVLLLDRGLSIHAVATQQRIHRQTVACHRDEWLARSFDGLRDRRRSGAPRKLSQRHQELLCAWAKEEAYTAPQLRTRLSDEEGMPASVWLVQHALKEKKYVWKRTRHRLRRKRDEQKFRAAQVEIAELVEKSKRGEITLGYVDEAGFAPTQPNRSAWTEQGEPHLITAERGKRLNVVAALLSTGALFSARFWETLTAAAFAGFLGLLLKSVGGPLTILLDKASIHKAKAIQPVLALLKQQGLTLIFLPPYRPELNRIEWLWHKMKYDWLPFKARTAEKLHEDVGKILDEFGSVCRMTFC